MHDTGSNDESVCIAHEPCPSCGSRDNLARYSDGHGYCFGCAYYEDGEEREESMTENNKEKSPLLFGEYNDIRKRRLTEDTCRKFGYHIAHFKGYVNKELREELTQVANYHDLNGKLIAQKVRFKDKAFTCLGDIKKAGLFGQQLWKPGGKMVVITEGEIDAMSVSQLQGNKWPVVSIPNGAGKGKGAAKVAKQIAESIEWLCSFEKVVILFDDDEPGRDSAEAVANALPPGKAFITFIEGYKDASEALVDGEGKRVIDAIWNAKPHRPDGLVTIDEIHEELLKPIEWGLSWPFESLTDYTYGIHRSSIYGFGAGTGVGKTDVMIQTAAHIITEHKLPVGLFYLEQPPKETVQRLCGKINGKLFHLPDGGWAKEEWEEALLKLKESNLVHLYNHFGQTDWDIIKSRIRYLVRARGVRDIFLDHLTALATGTQNSEKEELERIMEEMSSLAQELDITIYFVSHLTTPEGKPHEEGGRVMIRHFKGSRAIGFWSHFMFGLERDQQAKSETKRQVTTFRILKDRMSGKAVGKTISLKYDQTTGLLHEYHEEVEDFPEDNEDDF